MSGMDASIIIPTYNRSQSLKKTLGSLDIQSWNHDRYEVLVIDDGSEDNTSQVASETFSFPIRYFRQNNQGSAEARNRGAIESSGELLIFIDDDILAEPEYIEGLLEEHRANKEIVGMGTVYTHSCEPETLFSQIYSTVINPKDHTRQGAFVPFTDCTTNNLSVSKDDFFRIGMMQDVAGDGPTWWGDVDFGFRAFQLGFRFRKSGRAVCRHYDYSIQDFSTFCKRNQKAAQIAVLLFQKYPEVQSFLPMFEDKTPISFQNDPLQLIVQKVWHSVNSVNLIQGSMESIVGLLERTVPNPSLLWPLYRWIMSSYIYQGYRFGLQKFGPVKVQQ